jgi:hypothetical protein
MPGGISSLVNRLNLTSEEKALIAERISLGKEAFMKKYNLTQTVASNKNCPDGWTQTTHPTTGKLICVDQTDSNPVALNCNEDENKVEIGGQKYTFANFDGYSDDQKRDWAANVCNVSWRAVGA